MGISLLEYPNFQQSIFTVYWTTHAQQFLNNGKEFFMWETRILRHGPLTLIVLN
jgi:hypothetical protein